MTTAELQAERVEVDERPEWLTHDEWPFEVRFVELDGHRIHYIDEGAGPVLLFVHAGMWSFVWRDLILELRDEFRCVAIDFPGHGLSQAAPGYSVGLRNHADVLAGFVEKLGLSEFTLVGHDLGGLVGVLFAADHPEMIRGIVPVNTFAWRPDRFGLNMMLGLMGSRPMELFNRVTNLMPRATSGKFGVGRLLSKEGRAAFRGPFRQGEPRRNFHRMMRDTKRSSDLLDSAEQALKAQLSSQPMLLVYGEKNDPFGFGDRFKSMFPEASEYIVPGGNHFPMCDDPAGIATALRQWWGETYPA